MFPIGNPFSVMGLFDKNLVIKMKLLKFKGGFEWFKRYIRVYLYRNTVLSNHNLSDSDDFFEMDLNHHLLRIISRTKTS